MQDEIVARLANQLGTELTSAEAHRAERAPNPDSMDLFFQLKSFCVAKPMQKLRWAERGWSREFS
jgi:hypothetical protein